MDNGRTQDSTLSLTWSTPAHSDNASPSSYTTLPAFGTSPPSDFSSTAGSLAEVNPVFVDLNDYNLHSTTPSAVPPKQATQHISTLISKSPELLRSLENSRLDQAEGMLSITSRASTIVFVRLIDYSW